MYKFPSGIPGILKSRRTLPYFVIAGVGFIYLLTLSRQIVPGDSAELVTAAVDLGLCHPTGYPLYIVIGKLLTILLFFMSPAVALNASSLVFMLFTLVLMMHAMKRLAFGDFAISTSLFIFGMTPSVWRYSTFAEVYALHGLLFAIVILIIVSYERNPRPAKTYFLAFVAGLALGNHMTSVLTIPGIIVWIVLRTRNKIWSWRRISFSVVSFFAGCSIVLLIFALDRKDTINYINSYSLEYPDLQPNDRLDRFVWEITGSEYGAASNLKILFKRRAARRFYQEIFEIIAGEPLLYVVGTLGLLIASPIHLSRRHVGKFLGITYVLMLAFFATYRFFEPIHAVNAMLICTVGIANIIDRWIRGTGTRIATICLIVTLSATAVLEKYRYIDEPDIGDSLSQLDKYMTAMEDDAVFFSTWELSTLIWYLQFVENRHPGILLINADPDNWPRLMDVYCSGSRRCYFEHMPDDPKKRRIQEAGLYFRMIR